MTVVAEAAAEARRREIAKKEATTEIEVAESRGTGEAVSSGFRATCTTTATARTGAKSVDIVRPRDDVKYIAASSNATVAKSVAEGGSLPPWIVMFSVTAKCGTRSVTG